MIATTASAYMKIGDDLMYDGRFEEAIEAYDNALKLNHDTATKYQILKSKSGALLGVGSCWGAEGCLKEALSIAPPEEAPSILCDMGSILVEKYNFAEAIEMYKRALELKPNDGDILNNIGIVFARLNRYDDALIYFDKALMIPDSHNNKTRANIQNAKYSRDLHNHLLGLYRKRDEAQQKV